MRCLNLADRWRSAISTVFLISVLGVLFVWPLRAAPVRENLPFRIEIDLSSPQEWTIRATGPVRVGSNGQFAWPFRQEGFSTARTTSFSHRPVGSTTPIRHVAPGGPAPEFLPVPAELGYRPGDVVEIGLVRQVTALAGGDIDQAFVLPRRAGDAPVTIELRAPRPTVRIRSSGLLSRGEDLDLRGNRQFFEQDMSRSGASALHEFSTEPRLFLSTHDSYAALGRMMQERLPEPKVMANHVSQNTRPKDLVKSLLEQMPMRAGPAIERAQTLRFELAAKGLESELVFTNRRPILALPDVPVGLFDTVLVAIPSARLLVDPGAPAEIALDVDPEFGGRDALRLNANGARLEKMPLVRAAENRIFVRADLQIGRDGTIEGQSLTETSGPASIRLRQLLARLNRNSAESGLPALLQGQSLDGDARLGPLDLNGDVYGQHLSFRLNSSRTDDTVLRVATIPGPRLFKPPFLDLVPALQGQDVVAVPCRAVTLEHQIILHLPDKRLLVEHPKDIAVILPSGSYQVRYEVEQTRIIVRRRLEFEPGRAFCTREQVLEMAPLIRATSRDLARQLHLRQPAG